MNFQIRLAPLEFSAILISDKSLEFFLDVILDYEKSAELTEDQIEFKNSV